MAAMSYVMLLALTTVAVANNEVFRKLRDVDSLTELDRAEIARMNEADLPEPVQRITRVAKRSANFCCKNVPVDIITKTKSAARVQVIKSRFKIGDANCGTFGLGRCSRYDYRYRQVTTYVVEYFEEAVNGKCRSSDITCCNYYIKVAGKCVHLDDLSSVVDQLIG